jgi:hypothetical protein
MFKSRHTAIHISRTVTSTPTTTSSSSTTPTRSDRPPRVRVVRVPVGDEKYTKRRRQKRHERSFMVLMGTLLVLVLVLIGILCVLLQEFNVKPPMSPQASSTSSQPPSLFQRLRHSSKRDNANTINEHPAFAWLQDLEDAIQHNYRSTSTSTTGSTSGSVAWLNPRLLLSLKPGKPNLLLEQEQPSGIDARHRRDGKFSVHGNFFRVSRLKQRMDWEDEWDQLGLNLDQSQSQPQVGPKVDYTRPELYSYPEPQPEPPSQGYPKLTPLKDLFARWPQDVLGVDEYQPSPSTPIVETLQHFEYTTELEAARLYRDRKLPFKLVNVPELVAANTKWTDDYVTAQFDDNNNSNNDNKGDKTNNAHGKCQESRHNFFAFFQPNSWNIKEFQELPPTRNNDWTFRRWSLHARYSDAVALHPNQPHFYWQSGVPKEERDVSHEHWSFVSRDLPSFSSPNATFLSPSPQQQKGIQCRFGERGVTAATHFDSGRNMVGMITGAKRYVLSPPNQCQHLGIVTARSSTLYRHSLLNFGHFAELENPDMPTEEREWLEKAGNSLAVETVLKAGEVLYIPSHWFHYIISLQKSAQCNVRSGVDEEGDEEFGGQVDVQDHCDPTA